MEDLNRQIVSELRACCDRRWPGPVPLKDRHGRPKPKVTKITYQPIDGRTNVGKAARGEITPVPRAALGGEPDEEVEQGR